MLGKPEWSSGHPGVQRSPLGIVAPFQVPQPFTSPESEPEGGEKEQEEEREKQAKAEPAGRPSGSKAACPTAAERQARLDWNLLLGLERAFFAALNQCFTLIVLGIGLVSIPGDNAAPTTVGGLLMSAAVVYALLSYGMHLARLRAISRGAAVGVRGSVMWTGLLGVLLPLGTVLELHYSVLYPYLRRSAVVEVASAPPSDK